MLKGDGYKERSDLTIRGVIFNCLLCVLMLVLTAAVTEASGNVYGIINFKPFSLQHRLTWNLDYDLTKEHNLSGKIVINSSSESGLNFEFCNWIFNYQPDSIRQLTLSYNHPLITSADIFRILHKDYYGMDGLSLAYQQEAPEFLVIIIEKASISGGLTSPAAYFQVSQLLRQLNLKLSGLRYDSGYVWTQISDTNNWDFLRNLGDILVIEGWVDLTQSHSVNFGYGYQHRVYEQQGVADSFCSQALVVNGKFNHDFFYFEPGFRCIGKDFDWPLTKTKSYARDRIGFVSKTGFNLNQWKITLNYDQLSNMDKTRRYLNSNMRIEYRKSGRVGYMTINWQPNQRITYGYRRGKLNLEWRMDLPQVKLQYVLKNHEIKLASSSLSQHRIEYRYSGDVNFRVIYKLDTKTQRDYFYACTRFEKKGCWLELSYGESDNGQLAAKFDLEPSLQFSWGWSW